MIMIELRARLCCPSWLCVHCNSKMADSQQTDHPVRMEKLGPSPDEIKQTITSKMNSLFLQSVDDSVKKKIQERRDNIIKYTSCSINKDGSLDKRRCSTFVLQLLAVCPAPTTPDQKCLSPPRVHQEETSMGLTNVAGNGMTYLEYLQKEKLMSQENLFFQLNSQGKLKYKTNGNGLLLDRPNGRELSHVELCKELDEIANCYLEEYMEQGHNMGSLHEQNSQKKELSPLIKPCFTCVVFRIGLMMLFPDNILSDVGMKKWKKHLDLVASFATLTIALDLFGSKSFILENIV